MKWLTAGIASLFAFGSVVAGTLEPIPYSTAMTATGSSEYNAERGFKHAIDGSGLSLNNDVWVHTKTYNNTMWMTTSVALSPSAPKFYCVDLGATYNLTRIKIWNFNQSGSQTRGFKATEIYVTNDAEAGRSNVADIRAWGEPLWTGELSKATGDNDPGCPPIDFSERSVRFVAFVVTSSHGDEKLQGLSEVQFFEYQVAEGEPVLKDCLVNGTDGSYAVGGALENSSAHLGTIISDGGEDTVTNMATEVSAIGSFTVPVQNGLSNGKTFEIQACAEAGGFFACQSAGTIYTGTPVVEWVQDGSEYALKPAEFRISRLSEDPYPLTVSYSVSSALEGAAAGKNWVAPSGVAIIPAQAKSVVVPIAPICDMTCTEDVPLTVTLTPGTYLLATPQTARGVITNLAVPAGYNTWVAGADGLASDPSNWSEGRVPSTSDNVLFDGNFSKANCEWDSETENGPSSTVASWTQRDGYTGLVMVDTAYEGMGDFTCLTVTGDMSVESGAISQHTNTTANVDLYRLRLDVGGDLTVAAGAKIDVTACGPSNGRQNASVAYAADMDTIGSTWGDPKLPTLCGRAGQNKTPAGAGGAVYITVGGTTTLNGSLLAQGVRTISPYANTFNGWGCGGSIYLETGSFTGSGIVSVNAELNTKGDNSRGTPGRISVWCKTTESAFPVDNYRAWGDRSETDYNIGAGTVVVRNPGEPNGTLYVRNNPDRNFSYNITVPQQHQTTSIPKGDTWTFDAVVLGNYGMLTIPETSKLVLPNGFASVSCRNSGVAESSARNWHCGIIVREGGDVEAPAVDGKHEFKGGRWTFAPRATYVLTGDVEVSGGANIGVPLISQGTNNFITCNIKVVGDMDVKSTGLMSASYGGIGGNSSYPKQGYVSFPDGDGNASSGTGHGGQKATAAGNNSYDSFFCPQLPGAAGGHADVRNMGGGVINLEVTGTLNVDGKITSSAVSFGPDNHAGGAGSLNIKAGALTGSGLICADTTPTFNDYAKSGYGSSGGGRVAVRLTGKDASFSNYWIEHITAKGYSKVGNVPAKMTNDDLRYSSAGSVYLELASEAAKTNGTIYVRNDGVAANTAWTSLPAATRSETAEAFRYASLNLTGAGKVRLFDSLKMGGLSVDADSQVDLNGKTLTVKYAKIDGARLLPGRYTSESEELDGVLVDSGTGGALTVLGGGMRFILR